MEKLPMFAASRYIRYNPKWTERARIMKSADRSAQYFNDMQAGLLGDFLWKCLFFSCLEMQNHCRSFWGSDGRFYTNELCLDNLDGKNTIARAELSNYIKSGYKPSEIETSLLEKWNLILEKVKETEEYDPTFKYGIFQIDKEINIKIQQGTNRDGTPKMVNKYGDLNNLLKDMKPLLKEYYLQSIVPILFDYEFLK